MKVSNSWDTFTVGQYQRLVELSRADIVDPIDRAAHTAAILTNISYEEAMNLDRHQASEIIAQGAFLSTQYPKDFKNFVKLQGKNYVVNPDLSSYTFGMYMDYTALVKGGVDEINDNLHKLLAMFIREEGERYDSIKCADRAVIIQQELTMDIAGGVSAFFLKLWEALLNATLDYLTNQTKLTNAEVKMLRRIALGHGGHGGYGSIA